MDVFSKTWSVLICVLFQLLYHCSLAVGDVQAAYEELTTVQLSFPHRSRRSEGDRLRSVNMAFPFKGSVVILSLEKNMRMGNIRLSKLHGGHITEVSDGITKKESICAYQDRMNGAAITIRFGDIHTDGEHKTSGIFMLEGQQYTIQPVGSLVKNRTVSHGIRESEVPVDHGSDYISRDPSMMLTSISNAYYPRKKRATTPAYTVELLSVLDYTIYEYWNNTSTAKTKEGVWEETKTAIYYYYVTVLNGVDIRYRNMQNLPMAIKPVEIIITTDPLDSKWTLDNKDPGVPRDTLLSSLALDEFRTWVGNTIRTPHDHAMLFTRFDLKMSDTVNVGLAYMSKICTDSSQSIVEENFSFSVSTTAAHELGHNLGAKHDGDTNTCNGQDYYIMAAGSVPQTGTKARNPWIFSSCSIVYFQQMIQELDRTGINCLLVENNLSPVNITKYMSPLFGQMMKADAQCQHAVSNDSLFCAGSYENGDYSTICTLMWCKKPTPSFSCTSVTAADGTLCGDHKVCINAVCTDYPEAPKVGCYGDQYLRFCATSLSRWDCYSSTYLGYCCKTCERFKNPSFPTDCTYGDREGGCNVQSCSTYSQTKLQRCCGTCFQFFPNDTTTRNPLITTTKSSYFDGHDQCRSEVASDSKICGGIYNGNYDGVCSTLWCKNEGSTDSCAGLSPKESTLCGDNKICINSVCTFSSEVPVIGCFADLYMTFCMSLSRQQCYTTTNYDYCCRTCDAYKNSSFPSGCLFGDKEYGCSHNSCPTYTADKLDGCCGTCSHLLVTTITSTATPITTSTSTTTTPTTTTTTKPTTTTTTTTTTTKSTTTTTTPTTTTKPTTTTTTTTTTTKPTTTTSTTTTPTTTSTTTRTSTTATTTTSQTPTTTTFSTTIPPSTTTRNPLITTTKAAYLDGHDQCRSEVASDSRICGGIYNGNYDGICSRLWCKNAGSTDVCAGLNPKESTLCGDNKICIGGVCTYSSEVPFMEAGKLCSGPIFCECQRAQAHSHTLEPNVCSGTSRIGCLADLYMTFCMSLSRQQCYETNFYDYCCRTCDAYKSSAFSAGCLFGDKQYGCSYNSCPTYSADRLDGCCGTCSHLFASTTSTSTPVTTSTSTTSTQTTTTTKPTTTITTSTTTKPTTTRTTISLATTTTTTTTTPATTTTTTSATTTPTTSGPTSRAFTSTTSTITSTMKRPSTTTITTTATTPTTTSTTTTKKTTTSPPTSTTTTTVIPTTTTKPTTVGTTTRTKAPTTTRTSSTTTPATSTTTTMGTTSTATTPSITTSTRPTIQTTTGSIPTSPTTLITGTTIKTTTSARRTTPSDDIPSVDKLTGSEIVAITVGVSSVIVVLCVIFCIAVIRSGLFGRQPNFSKLQTTHTEKTSFDSPSSSLDTPAIWFTRGKRFNPYGDTTNALDMYYYPPYSPDVRGKFKDTKKSYFSL